MKISKNEEPIYNIIERRNCRYKPIESSNKTYVTK